MDIERLKIPAEIKEALDQNRLILEINCQLIRRYLCPPMVIHDSNTDGVFK